MLEHTSSVLHVAALLHAALLVPLGLWFLIEAPSIESHHAAWKPFKFALSIGLFLFTIAWLTPCRRCFSWPFSFTISLCRRVRDAGSCTARSALAWRSLSRRIYRRIGGSPFCGALEEGAFELL